MRIVNYLCEFGSSQRCIISKRKFFSVPSIKYNMAIYGNLSYRNYMPMSSGEKLLHLNVDLLNASASGNLQQVEDLINRGANVFASAIYEAGRYGHLPVVEYLFQYIPEDVRPGSKLNDDLNLALNGASMKGHLPVVQYIIENTPPILDLDFALKTAQNSGFRNVADYLNRIRNI